MSSSLSKTLTKYSTEFPLTLSLDEKAYHSQVSSLREEVQRFRRLYGQDPEEILLGTPTFHRLGAPTTFEDIPVRGTSEGFISFIFKTERNN